MDGIVFDLTGIQGERINEAAEYKGARLRVPASLDGARISMQIDVGFGDLVDPPPADITLPVLLRLDAPVIRGYPPEAVIAEKFHAMVVLGIANSRMKDFFDVWTLGRSRRFDLDRLSHSVRSTFERRRTALPRTVPLALTAEFLEDRLKQTQCLAFGKRLGFLGLPTLPLIGERIATFLLPVLDALNAAGSSAQAWEPGGPWVGEVRDSAAPIWRAQSIQNSPNEPAERVRMRQGPARVVPSATLQDIPNSAKHFDAVLPAGQQNHRTLHSGAFSANPPEFLRRHLLGRRRLPKRRAPSCGRGALTNLRITPVAGGLPSSDRDQICVDTPAPADATAPSAALAGGSLPRSTGKPVASSQKVLSLS